MAFKRKSAVKPWLRPRPQTKDSGAQTETDRLNEPFTTIDDALRLAQKLSTHLERLGSYKHPLAVRKGMQPVNGEAAHAQIKASGRTYFFDLASTKDGQPYLKITESHKGKADQMWQRTTVNVFPEDARAFVNTVTQMVTRLG